MHIGFVLIPAGELDQKSAKCLDSTQALFDCGLEIPPAQQILYSLALGYSENCNNDSTTCGDS